jgi:uncharacterized protein YodC (DUF2158 family)
MWEKTMAFAVGDTVKLKSGGPIMTVEDVDSGDGANVDIICVWFEKNQRQDGRFKAGTLKQANVENRAVGISSNLAR